MSKKTVFKFRVHTGQWDAHGEKCLLIVGGGLKPDGKNRVWLTKPNGEKLFSVHRSQVEPVSNDEAHKSIVREFELAKKLESAPRN